MNDDHEAHVIAHKTAVARLLVTDENTLRSYGPVRRNGKTRWRNYRREIPGGKSFVDLLHEQLEAVHAHMVDHLTHTVFRAQNEP